MIIIIIKIRFFSSQKLLNNKQITNRVAELYSKTAYRRLNKELNDDSILRKIYSNLNLEVIHDDNPTIYKKIKIKELELHEKTNFKIHFLDYLKLAVNLKDDYRKLINNPLRKGYVYIKPERLNRLIQEIVREKISTLIQIENREEILKNEVFKAVFEAIEKIWEEKKTEHELKIDYSTLEGKEQKEFFPPCIIKIIEKAEEGQNLIHIERLFLVWFLIDQKYPEEEIINYFSALPDFDRDKTTYQVRYAMRKGYKPYSCESLKSYDLCYAKDDEICLEGYYSRTQEKQMEIYKPTRYVDVKKFRLSKKVEDNNIDSKNNNERP